jgi:hypothetical protein
LTALVSGCHAAPKAEPPMPKVCFGERIVLVHNASSSAIDVYMYSQRLKNGTILGTAPIGGAQFVLPPLDATERVWFVGRPNRNGRTGGLVDGQRVSYDEQCRDK